MKLCTEDDSSLSGPALRTEEGIDYAASVPPSNSSGIMEFEKKRSSSSNINKKMRASSGKFQAMKGKKKGSAKNLLVPRSKGTAKTIIHEEEPSIQRDSY